MTGAAASVLLACDGFRGSGGLAAPSLLAGRSDVGRVVADRWGGPGDSLGRRRDRLAARCADLAPDTRLHLVAVSMGCHVGVHLLVDLLAGRSDLRLDQVVLIAPDPKVVPCSRDRAETAAGQVSAHDEAAELWGTPNPGEAMVPATCAVLAGAGRSRLVVCRTDRVAGWDANAEVLVSACRSVPGVAVIEAIDRARVSAHGLEVDLSGGVGTEVHDRLGGAVRSCARADREGPTW